MADFIYNKFKTGAMQGSYNLGSFPLYVAIATNSYTPDIDNDAYLAHVIGTAGQEVSGVAYTSPGVALSNPAVTQDDTDDEGVLDADDILWAGATFGSALYAIVYGSSGLGTASDPLVMAMYLGTDSSTANYWAVTAGTFQVTWNAEGLLNLN